MPEPPDFDQIAQQVLREQGVHEDYAGQLHIANALRLVWNARGAADLEAMETAHENYNWTELEDALRALDR